MKKIILLMVCFATCATTLIADNDKPISADLLPNKAKRFIETYFAASKVSYAKVETEVLNKSYTVVFTDGVKAEFDKKGNWKEVDCKRTQVPEGIVPSKIRDYVTINHPDGKIIKIDRDSHDQEVKLSNGLELKFNLKGKVIGIDD